MTSTLPQATGRLTWLPLCEYKGDGRVVSLTQAGKEIQVFSLPPFAPFLALVLFLVLALHKGDREKEDCGRNEDGDQGALHHHGYDDDGDDDNEEDEVEDDGSDEDDGGNQGAVHHQAQLQR